jgi:uncharacterized protein YigE (DUF2233 family)
MRIRRPLRIILGGLLIALAWTGAAGEARVGWRVLEPGLELAEIASPVASKVGDSRITVLRIDPARFALKLLAAKELGGARMTARQWAGKYGLVAAINAGMYQEDGLTSVGYMRNFDRVNNGHINPNQAVLAFNRKTGAVPEAQIIDRTCQDFAALRKSYDTLVQSIRMVSCGQKNVWDPQARSWSMAAVAMDKSGRVLFVISRSPFTVHVFINILLGLPLDIHNAMYLEGGPKASLYVSANGAEIEKIGRFETIFLESDTNAPALPLPNVIGVVRKPSG